MPLAPHAVPERRLFRVKGVVQGVGFRPFVHRLAVRHGLAGFVLNDAEGVLIEAEGDPSALDGFAAALEAEAPPLARPAGVSASRVAPTSESGFRIAPSPPGGGRAPVPPDAATCGECLRELFDPLDRRHRYPFLNCTACGPRFTIVERTPYDRANTTMAGFEMCARCRAEYEDPADRRYHAEPIACPDCGPRLRLDAGGDEARLGEEALAAAISLLRKGRIVAIKGLGGYHLACDAGDEAAVGRLRRRKARDEKPFAVMSAAPAELAALDAEEGDALRSPQRPIVIARRRAGAPLAEGVAPGSALVGVMLPYTPLHHLIAADLGRPLVMTSGNRTDEPIAFEDEDARARLAGIADAILAHDRPIRRRCEDSVVRAGFPLRRSRGAAPAPVTLPVPASRPLVAAGAELKGAFCVARGAEAFCSAHLGDLDSPAAQRAFRDDVRLFTAMLGTEPELAAHDLHPDYASTRWALEQDAEPIAVQHHHAHAASCLAEHGESGEALGLVFDGTGLGTDGTIWGGELLRFDLAELERVAHLEPVPLPGGDAAVREPWRLAAMHLEREGLPVPFARWAQVRESLKVNAPLSSGMGRLFDAVAALLGLRERVSFEGQAAMELEALAGDLAAEPYACRVEGGVIRGGDLVAAAARDLDTARPAAEIAAAFHEGVAAAGASACEQAAEPRTVVLSGGCFQNLRLLRSTRARLCTLGFRVLTHRLVPPNDGGISYGQAAIAARRSSGCA